MVVAASLHTEAENWIQNKVSDIDKRLNIDNLDMMDTVYVEMWDTVYADVLDTEDIDIIDTVNLAPYDTINLADYDTLNLELESVRKETDNANKNSLSDNLSEETAIVNELFPEGKQNIWDSKVDEARQVMYCQSPNYDKAITLLKEASDHGNTNAMWILAKIYMEGSHTKYNIDSAWRYATKSSAAGNPIGTYWLSVLYDRGEGAYSQNVIENRKRAEALYNESLTALKKELGGKRSEEFNKDYNELRKADIWETMGRMMETQKQNESYAIEYFEKAANEGSSYAQLRMGDWCMTGSLNSVDNLYDRTIDSDKIPVLSSYAEAMTYYQKAANQGDAMALNTLGVLIIQKSIAKNTQDVQNDYYFKQAFLCFKESSLQNNVDALYNLAYCYEMGYGCEKNIEMAKRYYNSAMLNGSKKAEWRLTSLSAGQIGAKEWVDLGLPSGTLWATCNVGANSPEEYGDYFAWGETLPKKDYEWDTYKYGSYSKITKYCTDKGNGFVDNRTELESEDDAATANWGDEWQTPSIMQIEELIDQNNTEILWSSQNGIPGRRITSKRNGKSIFLPATGYYAGFDRYDFMLGGRLWSRQLSMDNYSSSIASRQARGYIFDVGSAIFSRSVGCCIRPVRVGK